MLENLYFLIEIITILLMLWALHGSKKKPGIYTITFICLSLIIENAIFLKWISANYIFVIHMGIVMLGVFEFKDSIKNSLLYGIFNIVILFIIQYIIGILFTLIFHIDYFRTKELLILQSVFFIIVLILYLKANLQKVCKIIINNNVISTIILLLLGSASIVYIIQFHLWDNLYWENIIYVALFFIIVMALVFEWQRENYISKKKSAELEIFREYNSIYKDLILNMRKKQHDFDNHLQAILSMNMMAENLEELIKRQNNYCKELMESNQDSVFLKAEVNSVYLAFLYTKKKKAEESGIEVRYRFDCRDIESYISFMDFITILGNLLDNAIEAVQIENHKIIILEILQYNNSVLIRVFNTYNFADGEIPANFFLGKSKKGENHGLGLSNVMDVVKRYHGIVETTFDYVEQDKFYKLSLQLFWKKE